MEIPAGRYHGARGQIAEERGKSGGNQKKPPFQIRGAETHRLQQVAMALPNEADFPAGKLVHKRWLLVRSSAKTAKPRLQAKGEGKWREREREREIMGSNEWDSSQKLVGTRDQFRTEAIN